MSENNQFKVAFTGHRHLKYGDVESSLINLHSDFPGAMWITGGAYGLDSHAARFALDHSIPLFLVLPFPAKVLCVYWPSGDARDLLFRSVRDFAKLSVVSPVFSSVRISAEMSAFYTWLLFKMQNKNCDLF